MITLEGQGSIRKLNIPFIICYYCTISHPLTKYVHIFTCLEFLQWWWQQLKLYSIKG